MHPGVAQLAWHLILEMQFLYEPLSQGQLLLRPGGKVENHRERQHLVTSGSCDEITRQLQQQCGLPRPGFAQDEQFTTGPVIDLAHSGASFEKERCTIRLREDETPGVFNRVGKCSESQHNACHTVQGMFQNARDPERLDFVQ